MTWCWFGSDITGFSPMIYRAFTSPAWAAFIISTRVSPGFVDKSRDTPGRLELFLVLLAGDRLIGGIALRQAAHIAGALDVVLSAKRIDAAAGNTHVAEEHLEVGRRFDSVHAGYKLGNAHGIVEGHGLESRHEPGSLYDIVRVIDAADFRHIFRRIFFEGLCQLVKTLAPCFHIFFVVESFFDKDMHETVQDGNVGARLDLENSNRHISRVRSFGGRPR